MLTIIELLIEVDKSTLMWQIDQQIEFQNKYHLTTYIIMNDITSIK